MSLNSILDCTGLVLGTMSVIEQRSLLRNRNPYGQDHVMFYHLPTVFMRYSQRSLGRSMGALEVSLRMENILSQAQTRLSSLSRLLGPIALLNCARTADTATTILSNGPSRSTKTSLTTHVYLANLPAPPMLLCGGGPPVTRSFPKTAPCFLSPVWVFFHRISSHSWSLA